MGTFFDPDFIDNDTIENLSTIDEIYKTEEVIREESPPKKKRRRKKKKNKTTTS